MEQRKRRKKEITNLKEYLPEFCEAKERNDKERMEEIVDYVFETRLVKNLFENGFTSYVYQFYGCERLRFIYENFDQEEWNSCIIQETKKNFMKDFRLKDNPDDEVTAKKMLITFLKQRSRSALRTVTLNNAREEIPTLTMHYMCKYILMRKKNLELSDYDVSSKESMEKMKNDTGFPLDTCIFLFYAFGDISKEEATKYLRIAQGKSVETLEEKKVVTLNDINDETLMELGLF